MADGTLLDLSAIAHDDSTAQGLKLPQNTALTAISSTGEGYLAYDSDDDKVKVFDGTNWSDVSGTTYTEGNYIDIAANQISFDPTELGTVTWYNGTAATDIIWTFDGESNDGTFGFYEDEDAFAITGNAIVVKQWFQSLLVASGFELKQHVVMLELNQLNFQPCPMPDGIRIRPMQDEDISTIARVDLAAFGPFWHNTENVLHRARVQCASATIDEDDSGVLGYQLSTKNPFGAHLARLAVKPESQGRGIGTALVNHLIHSFDAGQFS